ncbi:MAG: hypothetical protein ABS36_07355 [Acidobacteria bacterium SCN 69-37]|nr:MAG: hypothetical protein ABS36_07355 [Acidobacteria bacterium SCN 69-37]
MSRRLLWIGGLLLVAAQFVPVQRTNPPIEQDVAAPAAVDALLRRACYDCHSHETVWPWYARVAPVSWLVVHDTNEGRRHINFSTWNQLTPAERVRALEDTWKAVDTGRMPMSIYVPMHPDARLSDADKATLAAWIHDATH